VTHEGRKKYLLIADDDPAIREVLTLLLTGEGYAVVCAEDGQTVAELAAPEIDLYILDVNMPRTSGFSAGAEIRKRIFSPDHIYQSVWNDNAVGDAAAMVTAPLNAIL
jgi:DNA-binding response OmpR family regulator